MLAGDCFWESDSISIQTSDNSPIQIFDLSGNSVYSGTPTTLTLPRGHYIVECNGDRNQFAVLPNDYNGASFLGTEADDGTEPQLTQRLAVINPSWVRTKAGEWATVEAQQGVWNWTAMDQVIAANAGRKIIAYAGNLLPTWVNSNNFATNYTQVVQALANRYSNQLTALEVWNEPWYNKFPSTTNFETLVPFYLQLQSQARQTVKAINPSIQVIGPAWSSFALSLTLTNSIDLFDGWSWHDYTRGGYAPDQNYGGPDWVPILETDGLSYYFGDFATQKPLLVDELGLYGQSALGITNTSNETLYRSNLDWYRGMCRAIKTAVMYRACGVEAIIPTSFTFYAGEPDPNLELYGWDLSSTNGGIPRGPHPKTSAFLMTSYWLNEARHWLAYRTPSTNAFLYAWQLTNNTSVVFAWATEGQTVPLQTNGMVQAYDIYGRTNNIAALTEEPALFFSNTLDPLTLLSAVRSNLIGITNTAPVIDPLPTESVVAGQPLQFTVSATDAERDPVTYSATTLPPGATFDPDTQTFSWTPSAGVSGPYTATFVATDSLGDSNSITTTLIVLGNLFDGLLSHWKFDESTGTIAADSAGTNNGTLIGFDFTTNSGWVSGIISNALSFDGANDFVSLDGNQINLTNNFSVSAWLYPRNASGAGAFISVRSLYVASGLRFFIYNNSLLVQGQTTAGWQASIFDTGAIQNGNWYHLAVVDDHSTILVYVNGVYLGSADWGGDLIMNTNTFSRIGSDGTQGADYFNGVIDEMMVFQRTLTVSQVQQLYQSGDQPPAFAPLGSQTIMSGHSLNFTISPAIDLVSANLIYSAAIPLPSGAIFNAATGAFSWTPSGTQTGTFTITFTATDGGGHKFPESTSILVFSASAPATLHLTSNPTLTNAVIQINSLAVAVAGETNTFAVSATDSNSNALFYTWTFGVGGTSARSTTNTSTHLYTTDCGPYTAAVTVDDGIFSTNATLTVSIACQLNTSQLLGTLNFAKTNADTCTLRAAFALPSTYSFSNKVVTLNIAGAETSFTLDSKGRGLTGLSRFNKPTYNKSTGLWTFNALLRNGSWQIPWAAHGLVNATVANPSVSVTLPVILAIDNESFMATPNRKYTSHCGQDWQRPVNKTTISFFPARQSRADHIPAFVEHNLRDDEHSLAHSSPRRAVRNRKSPIPQHRVTVLLDLLHQRKSREPAKHLHRLRRFRLRQQVLIVKGHKRVVTRAAHPMHRRPVVAHDRPMHRVHRLREGIGAARHSLRLIGLQRVRPRHATK